MSALLDVSDLARTYEARHGTWPFGKVATLHAVDGVSFRLEAGRTLGLVGESGCGKTTTAKLVLGLEEPTGGSIRRAKTCGRPQKVTRSVVGRARRWSFRLARFSIFSARPDSETWCQDSGGERATVSATRSGQNARLTSSPRAAISSFSFEVVPG